MQLGPQTKLETQFQTLWHLKKQTNKQKETASWLQFMCMEKNLNFDLFINNDIIITLLSIIFSLMSQLKEALNINALCTCVYIYIWQLSSFRVLMLWFIDLTVTQLFH